ERAAAVLNRHGGGDVRRRAAEWGGGEVWRTPLVAPPGEPHLRTVEQARTPGETAPPREPRFPTTFGEDVTHEKEEFPPVTAHRGEAALEIDYLGDFDLLYGKSGARYEEYAPAYRYGSQRAREQRFTGKDFSSCESNMREQWEREHPGSWERFKE